MTRIATREITPAYVPKGFVFRRRLDGAEASGFQSDAEQAQLIFTRGTDQAGWAMALTIHMGDTQQSLFGTEHRAGMPIEFGVPGATAVYHDGMWAMDAARAEAVGDPRAGLFWSRTAHSVTVHRDGRSYGVRAPYDVPRTDLTKMARELAKR